MRRGVIIQSKAPIARASNPWGESALYVRGTLRARGFKGALVGLDRIVQGTRGVAAQRAVDLFVSNLAAAGMPEEEIRDTMHVALDRVVEHSIQTQTKPAA